jgi:endo-1,4-beta-mannosidase
VKNQPFILGVNYWPRRKAMYWWSDFEAQEVWDEFSLIKDLGMHLVRIFLLWDDWQPTPETVSQPALKHLETVCNTAADLELELDVTFFTGHMSGPNWAPGWMLQRDQPLPPRVKQLISGQSIVDCGYRNQYTDATTLKASELLLHTVVTTFKDHPGIGMWNLGNEPDLFAWPPDAAAGRAWANRMTNLIKEIDPDHPVTCGLHVASLVEDNGLRVNDIFDEVDVAVMHGYPMYASWSTGPLDSDFVPFLCALTSALCGKPTLMEEFGGCTALPGQPSSVWEWTAYGQPRTQFMAGEDEFAAYIAQVLPKLVQVGSSGAMLWCFADYIPALYDRPPCSESRHERYFGLVRPDGSIKPHAEAIRDFAATVPLVEPAHRTVNLDVSPETYYQDPLGHASRLYKAFSG